MKYSNNNLVPIDKLTDLFRHLATGKLFLSLEDVESFDEEYTSTQGVDYGYSDGYPDTCYDIIGFKDSPEQDIPLEGRIWVSEKYDVFEGQRRWIEEDAAFEEAVLVKVKVSK